MPDLRGFLAQWGGALVIYNAPLTRLAAPTRHPKAPGQG